MNNIWKGKTISLRAVEMSDLEDYFCNNSLVTNTDDQRNGDRSIFPRSKSLMADRVDKLSKINPYEQECFLIIVDNDGKPVGNINTHSCNRIDGTFQYGAGIKTEYRGKGYASEAIKLLMRFYFMELRYQKVETRVYSFNEDSIKLHEKLGFELEGVLRRSHFANGKYHDVKCFGMTKEEFKSKHADYL